MAGQQDARERSRRAFLQQAWTSAVKKCIVYILRCFDGSYYVGHTRDLSRRIRAHNDGKAAKYTYLRRPVTLCYDLLHSFPSAR